MTHRNAHHAAYGRWFDGPALRWFTDPDLAGGGALLDLGTHSVHLLRHLGGPVAEVWADIGNRSGNYEAVDDHGVIHLRFASGLIGRVEAAWIHHGGAKGLEIFGERGALSQRDGRTVIEAAGSDARDVEPGTARPDRVDRLLAVIDGSLPAHEWRTDLDAAVDAVAIMAAAYHAAESGTWQPVATSALTTS